MPKMVINPDKSNVSTFTSWLIHESCQDPNKIKKNRSYPIKKWENKISTVDHMERCKQRKNQKIKDKNKKLMLSSRH